MKNVIGPQGTNFILDEDASDYADETVRIITDHEPQKLDLPEEMGMGEAWWVDIPFADLRHLILDHIRRKSIKNIEAMGDDELEDWMEFS